MAFGANSNKASLLLIASTLAGCVIGLFYHAGIWTELSFERENPRVELGSFSKLDEGIAQGMMIPQSLRKGYRAVLGKHSEGHGIDGDVWPQRERDIRSRIDKKKRTITDATSQKASIVHNKVGTSSQHRVKVKGAHDGISKEREMIDREVGSGMVNGQLPVPNHGPVRRWVDKEHAKKAADMMLDAMRTTAPAPSLHNSSSVVHTLSSFQVQQRQHRGRHSQHLHSSRSSSSSISAHRALVAGTEDSEEYEEGMKDAQAFDRGLREGAQVMAHKKQAAGASSFLIVPVGGGRKAATTFIPSLVDIALNERKKVKLDQEHWDAESKEKALRQEEQAAHDQRQALRARAAAQRLVIRELEDDLQYGEKLAATANRPSSSYVASNNAAAAPSSLSTHYVADHSAISGRFQTKLPPDEDAARQLEKAAITVAPALPAHIQDPSLRKLARAAEKEVFREAAARMEREKLRRAMQRVHQDEAKIQREKQDEDRTRMMSGDAPD